MTNDTDSFVQEVDESLRQDRLVALLKKYGPWLIGAFVVFVLAVLGWQLWRDQQLNAARAEAERFSAALEMVQAGNLDGAKAEFERLSNRGPAAYRAMALMQHAAILAEQGDLDGAVAGFDAAAERANDPIMRQSAQLRAAYIAAETQDFDAMRARLQPIIDADTRLSYLARELLAVQAWKGGQLDVARDQLENLTLAFDAPEAVRQRAQVALAVIGPASPSAPADGATTQAPAPSEGESK